MPEEIRSLIHTVGGLSFVGLSLWLFVREVKKERLRRLKEFRRSKKRRKRKRRRGLR